MGIKTKWDTWSHFSKGNVKQIIKMNNNNKTMNETRNILRNLMGSGAERDICKTD